jgi:glycosyltransferase involved in cell wall biosynthesis
MKSASIIITRFPFAFQLGGEEIHTFMVAEYLREIGHNVEFLTSCPVLRQFAHSHNFKTRKIWMYKPPVSFSSYLVFNILSPILFLWSFIVVLLIRIFRRNPKIYALSFTEKLLFAPWCWLFGIKMVWVEHARIGNWFHKNIWKYWYKLWATGDMVTVVTVSKVMKKDLGISDVEIITNAIDTDIFSKLYNVSILPQQVRKYLQKTVFDVGYVGRLSEDKGMDLLIQLKKEMPEIGITTIGSGPYKNLLEENGIRNYPFMKKEEVACFMQNLDLLVLPATKTDPFGLVVIEAIAANCPTLITNKVGVSDYLVNNKETFIVDPEDFVAKVKELYKKPNLLAEVKANTDSTKSKFELEVMLKSYGKLFSN